MHISGEARFLFNIIGFVVAGDDCVWNVVAAACVSDNAVGTAGASSALARLLHTLRAQRRVTFFDHQAIAFLCRTDKEKAKAAIQQEQVRSAAFRVCNVAFCHARHRQWIWKPPYPVPYR